jgi:amino acid transporter
MTELTGMVGFASPISEKTLSRKRNIGVSLIATLALAASLIVAVTAVSIGVVRAQSLAGVRAADSSCRVHAMPAALMAGHHIAMPALW